MNNETNYRVLLSQRAYWEANGDTQAVKAIDRSIALLQEKMNEDDRLRWEKERKPAMERMAAREMVLIATGDN